MAPLSARGSCPVMAQDRSVWGHSWSGPGTRNGNPRSWTLLVLVPGCPLTLRGIWLPLSIRLLCRLSPFSFRLFFISSLCSFCSPSLSDTVQNGAYPSYHSELTNNLDVTVSNRDIYFHNFWYLSAESGHRQLFLPSLNILC